VTLLSDVRAEGIFNVTDSSQSTNLHGSNNLLAVGGVHAGGDATAASFMTLDGIRLAVDTGAVSNYFRNVKFVNLPTTVTQLTVSGLDGDTFAGTNIQFVPGVVNPGRYIEIFNIGDLIQNVVVNLSTPTPGCATITPLVTQNPFTLFVCS